MSKSADDKLKELLHGKFLGFESEVDDDLWKAVEEGIFRPSPIIRPSLIKAAAVFATAVMLVLSNGDSLQTAFITPFNPLRLAANDSEKMTSPALVDALKSTAVLKGTNRQPIPSVSKGLNAPAGYGSSFKPAKSTGARDQTSLVPDFPRVSRKSQLTSFARPTWPTYLTIASRSDKTNSTGNLEATPNARKATLEIFNGVDLHYLRLQPNPGDTLFFIAEANSFQVSPARAGVSPGIRTTLPLTARLHVNMSMVMAMRRHPLALSYQSLNQFGEPTSETRSSASYTVVSGGLAMGLSYRLTQFKIERRFDFGVDLQHSVRNPLAQNALVAYPNTLVSFNWGLSHYFNSKGAHRWVVRPNCGYSLNKKRSDAPLTAAPYSFGISLGVEF